MAEELWRNLAAARDGRPDSVHLAEYPVAPRPTSTAARCGDGGRASVVELGRRVRVETKVRIRQPLAKRSSTPG